MMFVFRVRLAFGMLIIKNLRWLSDFHQMPDVDYTVSVRIDVNVRDVNYLKEIGHLWIVVKLASEGDQELRSLSSE